MAIAQLTMGWLVVRLSGDPFTLAVLYALRSAPRLAVGLPAGVLGDAIGHRRTMVLADLLAASVLGGLAVLAGMGHLVLAWLFLASVLLSVADALRQSSAQALVDGARPGRGAAPLASLNLVGEMAMLVGSVAGGALFTHVGAAWTFGVAAFAHLCASTAMYLLPDPATKRASLPRGAMRAGVRLVRRDRQVRDLVFVIVGCEVCIFSAATLLPIFTHDALHSGATGLGILMGCVAAGAVVSLTWLIGRRGPALPGLLWISIVAGAASLIGLSVSSVLAVACVPVLVFGAALSGLDTLTQTLLQRSVPAAQRGAAAGIWVVAVGAAPIGDLATGAVASVIGVRATIAAFGCLGLLLALALRRLVLFHAGGMVPFDADPQLLSAGPGAFSGPQVVPPGGHLTPVEIEGGLPAHEGPDHPAA